MEKEINTIVIMVSIGNRCHLTNYSFKRVSKWAAYHNYSCVLFKKNNSFIQNRSPHFTKLIAHKEFPGFDRYVIIDDDILISSNAPALPNIPAGYIALCKDAEQSHTEAIHVSWTANSGFMIVNNAELHLLEEAYLAGEYPYKCYDGSQKGIWGPYDQGIVNHILFSKKKIYELDNRWNYQPVLDYFINNGVGWDKWKKSRATRLWYYITLLNHFSNNRKAIANAYCIHLIRAPYPFFFDKIIN